MLCANVKNRVRCSYSYTRRIRTHGRGTCGDRMGGGRSSVEVQGVEFLGIGVQLELPDGSVGKQ